ncbi:glycosyltransferase family 2 protein [Porphyromonas sp.]
MSLVTILLVVRDCAPYIAECIDSILAQTWTDFELLVIDDCSSDATPSIVRAYSDVRVRILEQPKADYIAALNLGLGMTQSKYIARMDGDDIMEPHRIQRQLEALEAHPDVALCCSAIQCFGASSQYVPCYGGRIDFPLIPMMTGNIVAHPTTILRRNFLERHRLAYHPDYLYAEDYKLWVDFAKAGASFIGIDAPLLRYRCSSNQVSTQKREEQARVAFRIQLEILEHVVRQYELDGLYEVLAQHNDQGELSPMAAIRVLQEVAAARAHELSNSSAGAVC